MDVAPPTPSDANDALDPRQLLQADLDSARAEAESIERAIAGDAERIVSIRDALNTMVAAVWRDVFSQQQRAKDGENLTSALRLEWLGAYQFIAFGLLIVVAAAAIYALQEAGVPVVAGVYVVLAFACYIGARSRCIDQIKKARHSYLGSDGKDVRFVAFTHIETGLQHPLIGFDGPQPGGELDDRAWKIPGVRDDEALKETFVEVIDERRSNVLLTRFPDKKPTLVHADLENPFVRAFGVFFQRALERHLPSVANEAEEFRQVVLRMGERKRLVERVQRIETELKEYDGTHAILSSAPVPMTVRNKLLRQAVLFRLNDGAIARGLLLLGEDDMALKEAAQILARAAAAAFVPFSFTSMKIGYVGQGASQVARTFESARRNPSMIYVEDGDRLFSNVGSAGYESMRREVMQAFLSQWDALEGRTDVWIVAGAAGRDAIDPAVLARFGSLVDITSAVRSEPTITIDSAGAGDPAIEDPVALPEAVQERIHIFAAMFAHVETMERQGIVVPRGVLITGPSLNAKNTAIQRLVAQAGIPLVQSELDGLHVAFARARELERAIVVVNIIDDGDPGDVAHLCVEIDDLIAMHAPVFVLGSAQQASTLDPELRSRFGDVLDIPALDATARRRRITELMTGKPVDFAVEDELDRFEILTDGMSEERLREYVEEAIGRAALRAIEVGSPDRVCAVLADFGLAPDRSLEGPAEAAAT